MNSFGVSVLQAYDNVSVSVNYTLSSSASGDSKDDVLTKHTGLY